MTTFCHFDVMIPSMGGGVERVAVVFTPAAIFNIRAAADELKLLFADALVPLRTIFVGIQDGLQQIQRLLDSDDLLHIHLPFDPKEAELFLFSSDGRLLNARSQGEPMKPSEEIAIRRQGLTSIFEAGNGLMQSGTSYHYVKPSGGHSKYFLRPGNIMRNGPEVAFIASWLLRKVSRFTPEIFADTASITQVAYALALLAKRLGICENEPSIQSFSSYKGMASADIFAPQHDALVLISASTSGSLRKRVIRLGAAPDNVITLFSMNGDSDSLCSLIYDEIDNPNGFQPFRTYPGSECPYCSQGSLPIVIAGDSFLPETPEPRLKLLKRTDKPKWLQKILGSLECNELIRCFHPIGEGKNLPIFVNLQGVCDSSEENASFDLPLARVTLADIDAIIHLPDAASSQLVQKSLQKFDSRKPIPLVADSDLDERLKALKEQKGRNLSITVVSSCIAGGFTLLGVSRTLRKFADQISYFIGLVLQPSQHAWEELKSNLELRNDDRGRNPIEVVWNAHMPKNSASHVSSWDIELRWLGENLEYLDDLNHPFFLRHQLLNNSDGQRENGLIDNAFLDSPNNKRLELAPNFAFHRVTKKYGRLNQADVFFVVSAILHSLRENGGSEGLRKSLNGPVLLSPTNFDRYNDSLLQAALLRSATPSELAYITHPHSSRMITDLIIHMMEDSESEDSEALPEFLLAVASGRMTLTQPDLRHLFEKFRVNLECSDYLGVFGPSLYDLSQKKA